MKNNYRIEKDSLGEVKLPVDALYGIHTYRALENFKLAGHTVHKQMIMAYGTVKLACSLTLHYLNVWKDKKIADAIIRACQELSDGLLSEHIIVDSLQGGAGTSLNMNVNEVIANRALRIINHKPGQYHIISPLNDINKHQSTNDTYPTALKLASIQLIRRLENAVVSLQETFQTKETQFAHIVKVGRTQFQDAVLTTLGREMSAYAEALTRDRWRIYKCEERLRVINLGGTAIGSGLAAPRQFIFRVVDELREQTGVGFARAENLTDATQNVDVFVEVSGILKACAVTLQKICSDLRFLSSGPESGIGELILPDRQAGSSIMPGKVNPVIPEAVTQAAMLIMGNDQTITIAAASGNLELNAFLPLISHCLLMNCELLTIACDTLRSKCITGLLADEDKCRKFVETSTATATALVGVLGYEKVAEIVVKFKETGKSIKQIAIAEYGITEKDFAELISPEAVCRLGSPKM